MKAPWEPASAHLRNALQIIVSLRVRYRGADAELIRALRRLRQRLPLALVQIERDERR